MTPGLTVPPRPPGTEAGRDEVLAWIAAGNGSYKAAARHFGLPPDRVKMWQRRAKNAPPPTVAVLAATRADPPPGKGKRPTDPGETFGGSRGHVSARRTAVVGEDAIEPEMKGNLRRGVWGMTSVLARVADDEAAHVETVAKRKQLLAGGTDPALLDDLAPWPLRMPMKDVASAAQALKATLEMAPWLAAANVALGGAGKSDAVTDADREAIREAMRGEMPGTPVLTALAGGREVTG